MKPAIAKLRLDVFNTFVNLVKFKSFSKTAEILGKSQGTVSQHLKELESALGCELIERGPKTFKLTDIGEFFYAELAEILDLLDKCTHEIEERMGFRHEKISIASSSIPGDFVLPQISMKFQEQKPPIDLNITITNSKIASERLHKGIVKFAAVGTLDFAKKDQIDVKTLGLDEIVILARKNHEIHDRLKQTALTRERAVKELLKYPWLFREEGSATRDFFFKNFHRSEEINIALEFYNNLALINALEHSDALTALSKQMLNLLPVNSKIKSVDIKELIPMKRELYLIKLTETSLNEGEKRFWNLIDELVEGD